MDDLFTIVGLGNPGERYKNTRHNAGFMVLDKLAEKYKLSWQDESYFNARVTELRVFDKKVLLCQPQTFMNLSGFALRKIADYYKIVTEKIMVVVDDVDLQLGEIRMRPAGGSAGHHGLESIETVFGTQNFPRQRIGIGRSPDQRDITEYVLEKFGPTEMAVINEVLTRAVSQLECWLQFGIQVAMNKFNGPLPLDKRIKE